MSAERDRAEGLARRFDDAYATRVAPDVAARHRARIAERARELADEAPPTSGGPRHLAPVVPLHRRLTRKTLVAAAAVLALVVAPVGVVVVSGASAPGDALYELKREQEAVRLATAASDAERGWTLVAQAERRLDELSRLSATERWEHAGPHVSEALEALRAAEAVGDPAVSAAVTRLRQRGAEQVTEVATLAPRATREQLEGSARVFTEQGGSAPNAPWLDADDEGEDREPHRSDRALAERDGEAEDGPEGGDGEVDEGPTLLEEPEPESAQAESPASTGSGSARRPLAPSGGDEPEDVESGDPSAEGEASTEDGDAAGEDEASTEGDEASTEDEEAAGEDEASTEGEEASTEDEEAAGEDEASTEDEDVARDDEASTEEDVADDEADEHESTDADDTAPHQGGAQREAR